MLLCWSLVADSAPILSISEDHLFMECLVGYELLRETQLKPDSTKWRKSSNITFFCSVIIFSLFSIFKSYLKYFVPLQFNENINCHPTWYILLEEVTKRTLYVTQVFLNVHHKMQDGYLPITGWVSIWNSKKFPACQKWKISESTWKISKWCAAVVSDLICPLWGFLSSAV